MDAINAFVNAPGNHEMLALLKGIRNGIVYGAKIRFPHALVMTLLWRRGSIQNLARIILRATYQHAKNLGQFVFLYKLINTILRRMGSGKKEPWQVFISACVGGYYVFGANNPINMQINMYLLSRIIFGLCRLGVQKGYLPSPNKTEGGRDPFPIFGAVVWGIVLWLFEYHRKTLQPSLQSSMTYLYDDSEEWSSIRDFLL
uniref:peroxisomal membrane protein 4-like n=1 Tax=Styela clava TaxID=7725 RepID=UPI00193A7BC2|nr:peroxisomal membrane protein 4-like [Styela clava]